MKFPVKKQLWMLCGGFLIVLSVLGTLSHVNSTRLGSSFDNVAEVQLPAVRNMTLADMMHDGLRSVVLASLLAAEGNEKDKQPEITQEAEEKAQQFRQYLETLEGLSLNSETKTAILETKPEMERYIDQTLAIVKAANNNGYEVAKQELPKFEQSFKSLETKMEQLGELIEKDASLMHSSSGVFRTVNLVFSVFGIVFCLGFGMWIIVGLNSRMVRFSEKIETTGRSLEETSTMLSQASQGLATGAAQSAASLQETVASLEELSSMVKLNSDNSKSASTLSAESFAASQEGAKSVKTLIQSMDVIKESSRKIEDVIQVIDDIAFQTNLLALNASVEAARAGEQGKGFAVVAEAVRSLAQRSADSAKEISKMIQESVHTINEGSLIAQESGAIIDKFLSSAQKVMEINNDIASSSHEQARGITLIGEAMGRLDQASQQNAQVAQDVSQTSEKISQISQGVQDVVGDLQQLVGRTK